ncbi:hypothetical protein A4U88_4561 [Serratia marcescens]|nr:hypothetical protein A4U88_4561 [Serratia marcescens]AXK24716.1 Hypothetical protein SmN45_2958 [Serratia marcescens]CDJ77441.1 Hypothetical protein SMB2099_2827 [Serratia marcescens SMB2099]
MCHCLLSLRVSCVLRNTVKRFGLVCPRRQPPSPQVSALP